MTVKPLPIAIAVLTLTLTACNKESAATKTGGSAGGEVLPGSASDAMLPLDTVRSQAPLAPRSETGDPPAKKGRPADKAAPGEAAAPSAAPGDSAPVPTVTPTAE